MRLSGIGLYAAAFAALPLAAQENAAARSIDTAHSTITIHVGKTGLFSAAGHDHTISAPIASGSLVESGSPRIEFRVETAKMIVEPDSRVDAKTQATIQQDMEEMTLETKKYPEIAFHSTQVEKLTGGRWKVVGELSLHGVTKSVAVTVEQDGDGYSTHTGLKQTDFGIKPISVAGGMVKVKNDIALDFRIVAAK